MKVLVSLEVQKEVRNALACEVDSRKSARLATRAEVRMYLEGCLNSLAGPTRTVAASHGRANDGASTTPPASPRSPSPGPASDLYRIDPEDEERLRGKPPSYVYGWNKVKRRHAREA
jgi:hypothetical protein